jgi:hypothetical protein
MSAARVGYLALLRRNRNFRRLWYGQVVSQLGDWLDSIALFTLLLNLTGSGEALGLLLVAEFLPPALVSPFAGVIVDRLPRKLVLIASDIGRAALVLLLLLPQGPGDIWLIYTVVGMKMALSAFFEPARSAILPSLCAREELVAANAISSTTWSTMLAIGAALGGLVAGLLGVRAAFILDAATYLLSAALIATVRVPQKDPEAAPPEGQGTRRQGRAESGARELIEGVRFIFATPALAWLTFTKAIWSIGGGALLLLTLYGRELFPLGRDGALSIGLLYAARGVGTGVGPLLALRFGGHEVGFLRRAIGPAFLLTATGYLALSGAPTLALAMLCAFLAHMGGSIQWVFGTALLQMRVPDRLRGRVFAIEYAGFTFTTALSSYLTGVARDAGASTRTLALAVGLIFALGGLTMLAALWRPDAVAAVATD